MSLREHLKEERLGGNGRRIGLKSKRRQWIGRYVAVLVAIDAAAATIAAVSAYLIRFADGAAGYLTFSLALPVLWVISAAMAKAYDDRVIGLGPKEFQRVALAFVGLLAVVCFFSYSTKAEVARGYIVLALPLALCLSLAGRCFARKRLHSLRRRGCCVHTVVAAGSEPALVDLVNRLAHEQSSGMKVVGACLASGDGASLVGLGVPLLGDVDDIALAVRTSGADTVVVASSAEIEPQRLRRLAWDLEGTNAELVVASGLIEVTGSRLYIHPVIGMPLLRVERPEFSGVHRVIKGTVDRLVSGLALLILAPLLLVIAAAVRFTSPGRAIFRQTRIGKDGREFTMFKFRSMRVDAEAQLVALESSNERAEGLLFKIKQDPRITPTGRWLRRLSLDELPQLFNVFTGHMSLVGPRPPLPSEVAHYSDDVRRRLLVKPGLTGLWQISGRSDLTWEESVRLDLRYVENWSLMMDLAILWRTAFAVVKSTGAY